MNMNESVKWASGVNKEEKISKLKSKIVSLKKARSEFDPRMVACWKKREGAIYLFLSLVFDMISKEKGRIVITDIVCSMLRSGMEITPDDLLPVVYLAADKIAPPHEGLEMLRLGVGDTASIIIKKALAEAFGMD